MVLIEDIHNHILEPKVVALEISGHSTYEASHRVFEHPFVPKPFH